MIDNIPAPITDVGARERVTVANAAYKTWCVLVADVS